jgi:hypothetical protein
MSHIPREYARDDAVWASPEKICRTREMRSQGMTLFSG